MKISYENTDEDAAAWNYVRLTRTAAGRKAQKNLRIVLTLLQALIGMLGYLLFCGIVGLSASMPVLLLYAALAAAFGYCAQRVQFRRVVRRQIKPLKKNGYFAQFLGPKEVTLSPEGLQTSWPEGEFLRRWNSIIRVEDTEEHLLFIYGDADFNIMPKRAFRDAAHQQEFISTIERFRAGAAAVGAGSVSPLTTPSTSPWWRNRSAVETNEESTIIQQNRS